MRSLAIPKDAHVCGDCGNRSECRRCFGSGLICPRWTASGPVDRVPGEGHQEPECGRCRDCPDGCDHGQTDCDSCGGLGYIRWDDDGHGVDHYRSMAPILARMLARERVALSEEVARLRDACEAALSGKGDWRAACQAALASGEARK